jgi:hypothetical protein
MNKKNDKKDITEILNQTGAIFKRIIEIKDHFETELKNLNRQTMIDIDRALEPLKKKGIETNPVKDILKDTGSGDLSGFDVSGLMDKKPAGQDEESKS